VTAGRGLQTTVPGGSGVGEGVGDGTGEAVGVAVGGGVPPAPTAADAFTRPYTPSDPVPATRSAVVNSRFTTDRLLLPQLLAQISAAAPAACGVDIEVPDIQT